MEAIKLRCVECDRYDNWEADDLKRLMTFKLGAPAHMIGQCEFCDEDTMHFHATMTTQEVHDWREENR